jgi:hypothetical protein
MKLLRTFAVLCSVTAFAQPSGDKSGDQSGHQGPPHGPPPQEALAACQGKAADAACSFTHEGHSVEGTCFTPATDKPLACRPAGGPPSHPRQ